MSNRFACKPGMRQERLTSPILFNPYINNLLRDIVEVEVAELSRKLLELLFADDAVFLAESKELLKTDLERIGYWRVQRKTETKHSKCGVLRVGDTANSTHDLITDIPHVHGYMYLGTKFDENLGLNVMGAYSVQAAWEF